MHPTHLPHPISASPRRPDDRRTSFRLGGVAAVLCLCAALVAAPAAAAQPAAAPNPPVVTANQVMPHLTALERIADRTGATAPTAPRGTASRSPM
ncbi:hypothetical protein [Streptomyces griseoaurantiacus]|uniref:hypothetical protein n=1 Tax=Streptomyces griseoaurantiacus TaxID=68213 RepID=UPI00346005AD